MFITEFGKRSLAVAILGSGVVACSSSSDGETVTATTLRSTTTSSGRTTTTVTQVTTSDDSAAPSTTTGPGEPLRWERVSFGFVSAYVLARGSELAIVDTGVSGGADRFDDAFAALSASWSDVDHVVLTHLHPDHIGGLGDVLAAAPDALTYAGEADVAGIASPRPLNTVNDGDEVFGLEIIGTPGHTPGHVAVYDAETRVLVAGDALIGADGDAIAGPSPQFSTDIDLANQSVLALAALPAETVVFGHGEPVVGGASALLAELASTI